MLGRDVFMESLLANGVQAIFGNPGTTENPLLESLLDYPQLPYYVALHESVAMAAANFYSLASGHPSLVNVHVAPGLGNAIGMMYGALKANSPVVVTAGQQDTRMRSREPLLSHDLVAMAAPVVKWAAEPHSADEMAPIMRRAFQIAMTPPRGPVFVSLPVDVMSDTTTVAAAASELAATPAASDDAVAQLVSHLNASTSPAIVAGDDVTAYGGTPYLIDIVDAIGAGVYQEGLRAYNNFPNRHPNNLGRIPFETASIRKVLAKHDLVWLIGGPFFEEIWYDEGAAIPEGCTVVQLENNAARLGYNHALALGLAGDVGATLQAVAQRLTQSQAAEARNASFAEAATNKQAADYEYVASLAGRTPMAPRTALDALASVCPKDAIVVDESITAMLDVASAFDFAEPHAWYGGRGGGIGQGIAGALGVQVAHADRQIVAISGDGSAMYSSQALWTAAHHDLPILFVIMANNEYRVLKHNLDIYRARFAAASNQGYPHMDLTQPTMDFVSLAHSHGIAAARAEQPDQVAELAQTAIAARKPFLLEVAVAGKH